MLCRGSCLVECCWFDMFLEFWEGFEVFWSREFKFFGEGSFNFFNILLDLYNGKLSGEEGILGLI